MSKYMMLKDYLLAEKITPILNEIFRERIRQNEKWGEQNHPMYNKSSCFLTSFEEEQYPSTFVLNNTLKRTRTNIENGGCWFDILIEEVCEAFLETEPEKQREEMVQVAAVAVAIIECLDRGMNNEDTH